MTGTMAGELRGREQETRAIEEFLERAAAKAGVLVLSGEAGIGKTALWQAALDRARASGARVLTHRAVEAEATLAFAGLSELLASVVDEILPALGELRRRALEAALLLEGPDAGTAAEPRAIGLAVLDSLKALCADAPLLLAVDDFQWLDTASARTLLFAIRRLTDERVATLLTVRPEARELERGLASGAAQRLTVGPLDLAALFAVLKGQLGLELSRPQLTQLRDATGGNPFFALQIARELALWPPAPGRPLPIPGALREVVGGRLSKLPAKSREALLLAAALARPTVGTLTAAQGDRATLLDGLEKAARADVVMLDGDTVRFSHPLLASVCYDQAPPWRRREAHARLATAVGDSEERVRHLALAAAGPDAGVAEALDQVAPRALGRGAPTAAAELYEIAAQLTPPSQPSACRHRRLQAAEAHRLAGDRARATTILDALLAEVPPGAERADVLFALARSRRADLRTITRWCEEALVHAGENDRRAAEIHTFLSWMRLLEGRLADGLAHSRAALEHADRAGDDDLIARAIARVGMAETWAVDVTPGLLERGMELERASGRWFEFHESPTAALGRRLICLNELSRARSIIEGLEARAAAVGDDGTRGHLLFHLAWLEWFAGRWEVSLERATTALELAEQMRDEQFRSMVLCGKAIAEAHLGRIESARAAAEEGAATAISVADEVFPIWNLSALGNLELSLGNLREAGEHLRMLPARLVEMGWNDPVDNVWPDSIEALVGLGELDRARTYVEHYELQAERSTSRWALAIASRCRGLLASAEGDLDGARAAFDRALAEHDRMEGEFERGRTLLAFGVVQRRAKQKRAARGSLERAVEIFTQHGALPWLDRANEELERISGRRPGSSALTTTEERVAELAAQGLANKEIAAAIYMSVHTVEGHLTRIYRKLDIRSRAALAARLGSSQEQKRPSERHQAREPIEPP
ncbi:MAG TPA: AAA family ATPase [Solirubrobacteraceae bacterium]|nr:AAA family ATPase [Solirubrobacteraceae bacterium]